MCAFCGCDRLEPLGALAGLLYWRCRNCGMNQANELAGEYEPADRDLAD